MKRIKKENFQEYMSKEIEAVEWIEENERVMVETLDCYGGSVLYGHDQLKNPSTGPIGIKNCKAGDILKINIHKIDIEDKGFAIIDHKSNYLAKFLDRYETKELPIVNKKIILNNKIQIPVDPMIGIIGVAPEEKCDNYTPKSHGGNMDCKLIKENSTVYLKAQIDGGLLSLGDLHASMGDGEVCVSGVEIPGKVTLSVELIRDTELPTPMVENKFLVSTIASHPTMDEALEQATKKMHNYLTNVKKVNKEDAAILMSTAGDLKICQVVDPWLTARFEIKKGLINNY